MASDGTGPPENDPSSDDTPPDGDSPPSLSERANPLVSSLCGALVSDDAEMAENAGIALCLVARRQPAKVSTIIGRLAARAAESPKAAPVIRTLGTLRSDHGREIRGALMTETGYSSARRIYGRIEHADPWELVAVDVDISEEDADPSFVSAVMRLVELEENNRDPLDSDAWTRFIQRLPGEGGETASEGDIERAAARQDSRPRSVRNRHRELERIANSRLFQAIEARSRFDDLEVLSPIRTQRFGKAIRTRGRVGAEEYAITVRLPHQVEQPGFRDRITDCFEAWNQLDEEGIVTVADWGDTPRPWVATEFVERTLRSYDRLSTVESLEHARTLTRALVALHQQGTVHGGIDPGSVGYPPNTLDGVVEPMLDNVGMVPAYCEFVDFDELLDIRYAAPECIDSEYGRLDDKTDVYHLGMVLYRAFTGHAPFDGDEESVRESIRTEQLSPPSKSHSGLPERIDEIIAKATAKQKLVRYENATRFHQEVRSLCGDVL